MSEYKGPERRQHRPWSLGRRADDRKWPRFARDLWLTIVSGVVLLALLNIGSETTDRIAAIQAQRRQSILSNCQAQNGRHDATITRLDIELKHFSKGVPPARQQEIKASRASTISLIDALAPKQDCAAAVRRATTTHLNHR